MEVLKKNILLVVVVVIALFLSGGIAFQVVGKIDEMDTAMAEVNTLKKKATSLKRLKDTPVPVEGNIKLIQEDIDELQNKLKKIRRTIGHPRRNALIVFAEVVGITEDELIKKWIDAYKSARTSNKNIQNIEILKNFLAEEFDREKKNNALVRFKEVIESRTSEIKLGYKKENGQLETLTDSEINDILLETLGIQREMSNIKCSTYLGRYKENLQYILSNKTKDSLPVRVSSNVYLNYAFSEFTSDNLPKKAETPNIIKQCGIIEDIIFRLKDSQITSLENLTKNSLEGVIKNDFQRFDYDIVIRGSLSRIKIFINSLNQAYEDNRIYKIKELFLKKLLDNTSSLTQMKEEHKIEDLAMKNQIMNKAMNKEALDMDDLLSRLPNYGKTILGEHQVEASIKLEYYIYLGNILNK